MARGPAPLPLEIPIPASVLNRRRLALRRTVPTEGIGPHRHRRMGQSLEFREFRDYQRGDDARMIDWAASHRMARRVVRTFEAEERRTLFLLLDCRPTMYLPEGADKLTIATWIAQALALAAQAEGDRVIVSTLFGPRDGAPMTLRPRRGQQEMIALGQALRDAAPRAEADWQGTGELAVAAISRLFTPASAVVLISDALFPIEAPGLVALAQAAQRSYRSLHLVELDAWPMERAMLSRGPFRLGALGRSGGSAALREASAAQLAEAEARLAAHRHRLRLAFRGPGLAWPDRPIRWPADPAPDPAAIAAWFQAAFLSAGALPALWSRAS
ncbi:DUF58 domain-containing protein [Mesobacterium pallidum]|uniref:DUF58 domain-containing protein n=1 Tax=Mesobacterium pallidum TaxID=2872037 RepID=UPI001EE36862|nr:DUF58 domain-containing protein [Mesobacterium pallidum]